MPRRIKVIWSATALNDLLQIVRYIKLDKPSAARQFSKSIKLKTSKLKKFPKIGRVVPELSQLGYRELIIGHYRVIYEINEDQNCVAILSLKQCKQSVDQNTEN